MSDRKVKRLTPNSIANLVMADEAWHDSLYVRAEDYDSLLADFEALRTALAAPRPEPVAWMWLKDGIPVNVFLSRGNADDRYWVGKGYSTAPLYTAPPAAAPEPPRHPGYIIGSHWLETAYSRICAGEAEADVLRDCGWERVDDALRRDAERYRYLRNRDPKEVFDKSGKAAGVWIDWENDMAGLQLLTGDDADAAIDAAMQEDKT